MFSRRLDGKKSRKSSETVVVERPKQEYVRGIPDYDFQVSLSFGHKDLFGTILLIGRTWWKYQLSFWELCHIPRQHTICFLFFRWEPLILSAVRHHLQWPTGEMKTKKNPVSRLSKARESPCDRQKVQVRNRFWFWWCCFLILISIWKMLCRGTLCGSKIPLEFFDLAVWLTVYNQFQVKYILLIK